MDIREERSLAVKTLAREVGERIKPYGIPEEEFANSSIFDFGNGVHIEVRKHLDFGNRTGKAEIALTSSFWGLRRETRVYKLESLDKAIARALFLVEEIKKWRAADEARLEEEKANKKAEQEELAGLSLHRTIRVQRRGCSEYRLQILEAWVSLDQIKEISAILDRVIQAGN